MTAETTTYSMTIPGHTARLNELMHCHWATKHRLKKRDRALVSIAARNHCVPLALGPRRVRITVVLPRGMRRPDVDAFHKSLLDALVCAGVLVDDGPKWCVLEPVECERGERAAIRVTVEDIEPEGR